MDDLLLMVPNSIEHYDPLVIENQEEQ